MLIQRQDLPSPALRPSGASGVQRPAGEVRRESHLATLPPLNGASDEQCAVFQRVFQRSGGLATSDALALFMRSQCDQPVSILARWIVRKHLVCLVWRSQTLIPMFQFDLAHCSVRAGMPEIIVELHAALDDFETIEWFARPNCWLAGAAPADVVPTDIQAVLEAARADRFVSLGG